MEFSGRTLEDLLKSVSTEDGPTLFDVLVDEAGIKQEYAVLVNGSPVAAKGERALQMDLADGDQVVAMAVLRMVRGGEGDQAH